MRVPVMLVAVVAGALALSGCGGDTAASPETATEPTTTEAATSTTTTTTTAPTTTTAAPRTRTITLVVKGGRPQGGIQRPTIDQGDKVVLVIRAASGEAVHLHGYNLEQEIVPGAAARMPFTADIAGRFELELHPTDTLLAVLEVKP